MQDSRSVESVHNHAFNAARRIGRERPAGDPCSQPVTNHASMRPGAFAGINDLPTDPRPGADLVPPSSNRQSWRPNDPPEDTQV